jgi:hypothetical protein
LKLNEKWRNGGGKELGKEFMVDEVETEGSLE